MGEFRAHKKFLLCYDGAYVGYVLIHDRMETMNLSRILRKQCLKTIKIRRNGFVVVKNVKSNDCKTTFHYLYFNGEIEDSPVLLEKLQLSGMYV